jgi:hypothetical protein
MFKFRKQKNGWAVNALLHKQKSPLLTGIFVAFFKDFGAFSAP